MMYKDLNEENKSLLLKEISNKLLIALEDLIILFNEKLGTREVKAKVAEVKSFIDDFWLRLEQIPYNFGEDTVNYIVGMKKYKGEYIDELMTSWMINEEIDTTEIIHEICYKVRELIKRVEV